MNGESVISNNGFHQIIIRYKTNHHLTINTNSISYYDGQNNVQYLWGEEPTQHTQEGYTLQRFSFNENLVICAIAHLFMKCYN